MKSIILSAPLLAQSGYSVHSRQVAQWLLNLERERSDIQVTFDIVPWGMCPYFVDPDACDGLIGQILQRTQKKELYDISIQYNTDKRNIIKNFLQYMICFQSDTVTSEFLNTAEFIIHNIEAPIDTSLKYMYHHLLHSS